MEIQNLNSSVINKKINYLLDDFLRSHDVKDISREAYKRRLSQFFIWCEKENITSPNRETILEYKRHLKAKKFTPLSEASYLVAVRCFFAWAERMKIYPERIGAINAIFFLQISEEIVT